MTEQIFSLDQLFAMEDAQLKLEHGREPDPKAWRWSPFDIRKFDHMLQIAQEYFLKGAAYTPSEQISFAEAGSGIGTKLYLAKHHYNMIEYGYEVNEDYLAKARQLGVTCEQCDLSDLDNQPAWAAYDIVYCARPFKDELFESKWEQEVRDGMRPGAVWMASFRAKVPYNWPCLYKAPWRGVWVKPVPASPEPVSVQSAVTVPL